MLFTLESLLGYNLLLQGSVVCAKKFGLGQARNMITKDLVFPKRCSHASTVQQNFSSDVLLFTTCIGQHAPLRRGALLPTCSGHICNRQQRVSNGQQRAAMG
eukprot:1138526-Pelagomonas_calceolata.AAC.6